jgi:RNA polymerase sigma factor (sigma-70 family)
MKPTLSRRDSLVHAHLGLADAIAGSFARRYVSLLERDDLIQVARLELVRAAERCVGDHPIPYLKTCINGALKHHLRDKALMVRRPVSARGDSPWGHLSLDALNPDGQCLLELIPASDADSPEAALDHGLAKLLEQLPAAEAAALRLTVMEGLSYRQAAAQLGHSPMTVLRAQRRALASLRESTKA